MFSSVSNFKTQKMINKIYFKTICAVAVLTVLNSCVKSDDYSVPPITCTDKFPATNHALSDLNALAKANPAESDIIKEDYIVEAYVSSNDQSGNIYKAIFVQDKPQNPTQGIEIDVDEGNQYANFPEGSKIRINLKGLVVQGVNNNIKIGPYDPNYPVGRINPRRIPNHIARSCGESGPVVAKMVPLEFNSISEAIKDGAHANQLVKINQVQFEDAELTKTFADPDRTSDRYITDKKSNRLDLRFSNYASFSTTPISPNYAKSGSIVVILSRYTNQFNNNITEQAYIRNLTDISFTKDRFEPGVPEAPSASATVLFKGADFENWNDFIASINPNFGLLYSKQGKGTGYNGGDALQIDATPSKNDFVFTALSNTTIPANPKRITFYIKGTAASKSLSFNVYKEGGSSYSAFNLGTFKNGAMLDSAQTNSYTGSIDTGGQWRLVELSLEGIDINRTSGKSLFAIKVGSNSAYNLLIDNIKIE